MKIARIETFLLHPGSGKNLLFCRVETEDGLYGWGEAYVTRGKERVIESCIHAMAEYVTGRSAFSIRHTAQVLFEDFAIRRVSMELLSAWSAIEIALWDILGKRTGQPVYNLLGGKSRARVRVYANGWSEGVDIDTNIRHAQRLKQLGFTAAKFDPFPGPWRSFVDPRDEDHAIAFVRQMRTAMGPEFELLIEAHRRFAPSHAISIGRRLAEFGITWYEEPCLADNVELLCEVRRAVPIPIVTGEALYSKEQFFQVLERRAADILNPDICACGGITALMDLSAMAQPQAVVMAPHNYNSVLMGLAATVHVCAVIPNFRIAEYFVNFTEPCEAVSTQRIEVKDGWAELPETPGLGVEIDVAKLRTHPYREFAHKKLTEDWQEYPRKDYVVAR
ncbi:MAG TPA: mandelate racemase/muconate lactonizing enzyme family protein [Acetobacteraceae bacterium]|jgi:galactonate dehydratase|nr:mandelate racemase/muconate lactonizing enzyme family protein [Acetobacteraceae bacterium]